MKRVGILSLIVVLVLCLALPGKLAAWFSPWSPIDVGGSVKNGYFAAGDGSAGRPYILTNEYHLYNLAWLQYYGYFPADGPTCFRVQASATDPAPTVIGMSGLRDGGRQLALPPIGTETHPFWGDFDGNRSTITDLLVSVAARDVAADANQSFAFGAYLGMFGTVDSGDAVKGQSWIRDFNLEGVVVRVDASAASTAGLIAGRAEDGVFANVGVNRGRIATVAGRTLASASALIGTTQTGSGQGQEAGGELIIDPNAETEGFVGLDGTPLGAAETAMEPAFIAKVSGAASGSAYYAKSQNAVMQFIARDNESNWIHPANWPDGVLNLSANLYHFNDQTQFELKFPNGNRDLGAADKALYEKLDRDIVQKFDASNLADMKILMMLYNGFYLDRTIAAEDGTMIPTGGVYFRPLISGRVYALICVPNPSNFAAGLFRLHRASPAALTGIERVREFVIESGEFMNAAMPDADGYDDATKMSSDYWNNPRIQSPTGRPFYFLFEADVHAGEEYMIGVSAVLSNQQSSFAYLLLPGTNQTGAGDGLTGVDFVPAGGHMWDEGYAFSGGASAVTLTLAGTAAAAVDVWFRRAGGSVLYYVDPAGGGVTAVSTFANAALDATAVWSAAPLRAVARGRPRSGPGG